ncbi:hypothetical protein [Runella sp.]|uniref:hypothetical protein n=1 Tax=Runella sp. TaxID=1960881 RepID=UPI003D0C6F94
MNAHSLAQKIIACLFTGLAGSALILQVGRDYRPAWISPPMVFSAAGAALIAALIFSFYWHFKKRNNASFFFSVLNTLCYALAFGIALFGWKKIFKLQFQVPVSMLDQPMTELSGEWLTWAYFGYSYPFALIVAFAQLGGSLLLLFPKTRLLGGVILLPVLLNILFINIFYHLNAGALLQSIILVLGLLYLLSLHYKEVITFFFRSFKGETQTNIIQRLIFLSAIVLPLILVFPSPTNATNELSGSYEVVPKRKPFSQSTDLSVGLTKVYFDMGNVVVLEYGNYQNRKMAAYSYDRDTRLLKATFSPDKQNEVMLVTLKNIDNQLYVDGNVNDQLFSVVLKKN